VSLLGWGSVPGAPGEVRAFMQRRVGSALAIVTTIWGVGAVLATFLAVSAGERIEGSSLVRAGVHLGTPVALALLWIATRSGRRSLGWLAAADIAATLLQGVALGVMIASAVPIAHLRPDMSLVLGFTYILATRAAVIPSTVTTTAVIGVLTSVPVVAGTYLLFRQAQLSGTAREILSGGVTPATLALADSMFCALSVLATAMISAAIHRLSRAVLRAQQLGQYTLEAKIGEGGMGIVYRARHALLRRPTAIKLLPAARAGAETVARFEREVQLTSQLTHPNTVAIYDYGRTPDNEFYYAMEFLDGIDLEELVAHDGPQPPGRVRHLLRQIAGALAEAHARGVVHRDVKPSNIMLCERGLLPDVVKVLDFGLARELEGGRSDVTQAGQLAGTPLYMSPEQVRSEPLDGRSDLYALGAVGYHLLTGQPVFSARTAVEVLAKHLHEPVEPPSKVLGRPLPPSLERLLLECLAKEPTARPASAAAVVSALDAAGGVPPWTDDDARRWWRERAPDMKARRGGAGAVSPVARTVAVDLGHRGA
jgi:hypothetical protein